MAYTVERTHAWPRTVALIAADSPIALDRSSVRELLTKAEMEADTKLLALPRGALGDDFYLFSSGLAAIVREELAAHGAKMAVWGDLGDVSQAFRAFVHDCAQGSDLRFVADREAALAWLGKA